MENIINNIAVMFIIPNYSLLSTCFLPYSREEKKWQWIKMCELNNAKAFDPEEDKLIQVWFHNKETDNLCNEWVTVHIDGKDYDYLLPQYVPAKLFEGIKEMDKFNLMIPVRARHWIEEIEDFEYLDLVINLKTVACQTKFRYGHLGTFEHVFERVCSYTDRPIQLKKEA